VDIVIGLFHSIDLTHLFVRINVIVLDDDDDDEDKEEMVGT
jgi:hypothetical protein